MFLTVTLIIYCLVPTFTFYEAFYEIVIAHVEIGFAKELDKM